ncbi:hypothetical protein T01_2708 [Trichinella spiralis]|uniref:Uncharacterized protein n=1 Tax=Trichinella spiralis TaxID=6334 RepID=A0A0V1ATA7_TRISP|nr:hypothetical protein T01_2708 [Trichinella spiralis]
MLCILGAVGNKVVVSTAALSETFHFDTLLAADHRSCDRRETKVGVAVMSNEGKNAEIKCDGRLWAKFSPPCLLAFANKTKCSFVL